ncbi:MAG: heparinase II/III family protein [Armatimonadetes bacterium]|nr:heparinase II/III family protein [Armatimonadota bacterium]
MRGIFAVLGLALIGEAGAQAAPAPEPPDISYVLRNIKPTHPRLFLNREMLQKIEREGLTPKRQEWLADLKAKVEGCPTPPAIDEELVAFMLSDQGGARYAPQDPPRVYEGDWGYFAARAALAYILTGEKGYYERAFTFLKHAAGIYTVIHENNRIPYGKAFGRLATLTAYDWLYNDLPPQERQTLGQSLFTSLHAFYTYWRGIRSGPGDIYTDNLMGWHLGLVFLGSGIEGVDDDACAALLRKEYDLHLAVFSQLSAGPDGVYLYGAWGYAPQNLQSEVNFMDTWRSAIGGSFARYFPKRSNMAAYFLWNTIAPARRPQLSYGWADEYHTTNRLGTYHWPYLNRAADLYAEMADEVDLDVLRAVSQFEAPLDYQQFLPEHPGACWLTPASPLLISPKVCSEQEIQAALARLPRARHFPDPVGHTFMNSGWGENDTYALFIAGRQSRVRKHYDENHFTIYKKGYLALDSGARGFSVSRKTGHANDPDHVGIDHEINYYYDTVAHNCVLIQMEGETLPGFWGQASDINTGGMNKNYGAQMKAFETNDHYTYIASDATSCYNEGKAEEVVRQFLFIYPDYFVVFDRVTSQRPEQKKSWLMHTQFEPQLQGDTFSAGQGEGKMFVRTLLPQDARFEKVGGPGKEFWAGGRNWPVRVDWQRLTPGQNLFGQWRMDVSSPEPERSTPFLHLIQVGDRQDLHEMTPARRIDAGRQVGVEFQAGKRTVRVLFNRDGEVGGQIRVTDRERLLADGPLTQKVMEQKGLALTR